MEKHFRARSTQARHLNACSMNWSQGATSKKESWMLRVWKRNYLMIGRTRTESDSHKVRYTGYMASMEPPELSRHSSTDWRYGTAKPYRVSLRKSKFHPHILPHCQEKGIARPESAWSYVAGQNFKSGSWKGEQQQGTLEQSAVTRGWAAVPRGAGCLSTQIPRIPTAARGKTAQREEWQRVNRLWMKKAQVWNGTDKNSIRAYIERSFNNLTDYRRAEVAYQELKAS